MVWEFGVHIGNDQTPPRLCVVSGRNCWGVPHVTLKISDGYWCYVRSNSYDSTDVDALMAGLREWVKEHSKPKQAKTKGE